MAFKIGAIADPVWEVEFPNGLKKKYDPWKLQQTIIQEQAKDKADAYEAIRVAAGLPMEADSPNEIDAEGNVLKWNTMTRNQCNELAAELGTFLDNLPVSKKLSSLSRK
jgi:hypothetical protein